MNTATQTNEMTAHIVPDNLRPNFLSWLAGDHFSMVEGLIFDLASSSCMDYSGGYWDFYSVHDKEGRQKSGYMALAVIEQEQEVKHKVTKASNGYEGEMTMEALGIAITLTAINSLLWHVYMQGNTEAKSIQDKFFSLRDFADQHAEAAAIFGYIN